MKKRDLSFKFFFCTNIFAKPVLLECISDDPIFEDEEVKEISLDLITENIYKNLNKSLEIVKNLQK